jgi:3-hydroxyacyl-[acyl-carrier-protein] dehydratase
LGGLANPLGGVYLRGVSTVAHERRRVSVAAEGASATGTAERLEYSSQPMRFGLIDRIVELTREQRIVAVKAVSLAEEYLADHFPTFPVLPGVFMLEALVEAGAWLVREARDFAPSVILLRSAKNVTYKSFVKPGNLLRLEVTCRRLAPDESSYDGVGFCNQDEVVRARFGLTHFSLAQRQGGLAPVDQRIVAEAKERFAYLRR